MLAHFSTSFLFFYSIFFGLFLVVVTIFVLSHLRISEESYSAVRLTLLHLANPRTHGKIKNPLHTFLEMKSTVGLYGRL